MTSSQEVAEGETIAQPQTSVFLAGDKDNITTRRHFLMHGGKSVQHTHTYRDPEHQSGVWASQSIEHHL